MTFFKIYLTNPSLRSALFSPLTATDEAIGQMARRLYLLNGYTQTGFKPWYARWPNGEVDMVGLEMKNLKPNWAVEIKWTDQYVQSTKEIRSLIKFCKENNLSNALVSTINLQTEKKIEGIKLNFIPATAYAFTVGANTFNK